MTAHGCAPPIVTCTPGVKHRTLPLAATWEFCERCYRLYLAEDQATVGATEAKVVLQRDIDLHVTCGIGAEIQIAFGILIEDIDRWRRNLMVNGQHGEHRFQAAGSAEQMTRHRFSGVDH